MTNVDKRERLQSVKKNEKYTCKACKNTVFQCQICKFVGFLLPSSSWSNSWWCFFFHELHKFVNIHVRDVPFTQNINCIIVIDSHGLRMNRLHTNRLLHRKCAVWIFIH